MKLLFCLLFCVTLFAGDADIQPLLLNSRALKRLKLDRDRQTDRWLAFEQRVRANQDSPERGVELAVYSAVMGDQARGHEAVEWTLDHPCVAFNSALVVSASEELQLADDAAKLSARSCPDAGHPLARFGVADNYVSRDEFLLALRPQEVDRPSWQQHVAALLLVTLDPNSQAAQFLQGWASEDRFILREGPGVVYEFLYANPYLPGVSYQNMKPWRYRAGSLRARSDWNPTACWIHLTPAGLQQQNCPADLLAHPSNWGDLLLMPVDRRCIDLPSRPEGPIVLSNLPPGHALSYSGNGEKVNYQVDAAGLWLTPPGTPGKLCVGR